MLKYSKLIVTIVGVLSMLLSSGLLSGTAKDIVTTLLAFATSLGVFQVPNKEG